MSITSPYFIIVIGSDNLAVKTATVSTLEFIVLVAFVAEIMGARFRDE